MPRWYSSHVGWPVEGMRLYGAIVTTWRLLVRHQIIHASTFSSIASTVRAGRVTVAKRHHLAVRRVSHIGSHLVLVSWLLASAVHLTRARAPAGLGMPICATAIGAIPTRIFQIGGGWRCTIAPRSTIRLSRLLFRLVKILGRTLLTGLQLMGWRLATRQLLVMSTLLMVWWWILRLRRKLVRRELMLTLREVMTIMLIVVAS